MLSVSTITSSDIGSATNNFQAGNGDLICFKDRGVKNKWVFHYFSSCDSSSFNKYYIAEKMT